MLLVGAWCTPGWGADPAIPDFQRDIRPLLKNHCLKCHGPLRPAGQLNLSLPATVARGGAGGPAIVPGQPAASLLWQRVERDEMPETEPLPAHKKQLLRSWIAAGAPGLPEIRRAHV